MLTPLEQFFMNHVADQLTVEKRKIFLDILEKIQHPDDTLYNIKLFKVCDSKAMDCIRIVRLHYPAISLREARDIVIAVEEGRGGYYLGALKSQAAENLISDLIREGHAATKEIIR